MRKRRSSKPIPNDPIVKLVVDTPKRKGVSPLVLARSRAKPKPDSSFTVPSFPPAAIPNNGKAKHPLAMDKQIIEVNAWANQNLYNGAFNNGATFLGYPYLAELAQIPEYRKITETIAMHMTRKFIALQSVSGGSEGEIDKTEKIKQINDDLENFKVRDLFRKAAEVDGYFGRAHLYIDLGNPEDPKELKYDIGDGRNAISRLKVTQGSLKGFKIIEPVWTYPSSYNSNDPLTGDWYNPQSWFVMGKELHVSRCIRMVGREVSDLLKPAYSFGGLSLSQIAKPYIDNWLRTRQSVADLVWSFSVSGVMTDLSTLMTGDGEALYDRAELFNNLRNNRGMMMLNKDSEEFFQVATPLGTLDKLQAQAQEHMASVSSIPLIFLLGITPSGLNASSEGEIRAFYDFIHAFQMKFFTEPLTRVIDFIQLNRFGQIDPDITFIFEPLWSMTEKEQAEVDKTSAETDDLRINGGVISPLEARKRVAASPDAPYANLNITELPVPPGADDVDGDGEIEPGEEQPIGGESLDPGKPKGGDNIKPPFAKDEFNESKHPRGQPGNAGQFGSGGGGSTAAVSAANAKLASSLVNKPAGISGKYRQSIQTLLKDPNITAIMKVQLKKKIIESYTGKKTQLIKMNGDPDKINSIQKKLNVLNKSIGNNTGGSGAGGPGPVGHEDQDDHGNPFELQLTDNNGKAINPITYTDAEIAQAKKSTSLPNYGNSAAVHAFNDKWAGKSLTDQHLIEEKIDDYKEMKKKTDAENASKQAAEKEKNEKAVADQKEKDKKQAEKLAAEMNDPEVAKHYEVLKSISGGLTDKRKKDLDNQIKSAGLEGKINAVDCALIQAYTDTDYGPVNKQMRAGQLTKVQFAYAQSLQKALKKLPDFQGIVKRGTDLPDNVFKKYVPGYIIPERAFTSTGEGYKFSGTHTYEIEATAGKDVRHISSQGEGEQEVIFPAGSHFEVISVTGKHIKMRQVENLDG